MKATIKSRLTSGLGFLFLIILLLSGVGGYFLYQLSRSAEASLTDNYRSIEYARHLSESLSDLREARLIGRPGLEAEQAFQRYLRAEQQNITEPGERELADSLAPGFQQFKSADAATQAVVYARLRGQIGRVATLNLRAIEQRSSHTRNVANQTIGVLALLAAVGILATLSFIFSFPDYITKPVQELTASIRRVAEGQYDQRLPDHRNDEFAEVARAFNDMARRLEGYETADGTPRIDSSGPLDLVTVYRRPGARPNPPAEGPSAAQQKLVVELRNQARQLQRTADALLNSDLPTT